MCPYLHGVREAPDSFPRHQRMDGRAQLLSDVLLAQGVNGVPKVRSSRHVCKVVHFCFFWFGFL